MASPPDRGDGPRRRAATRPGPAPASPRERFLETDAYRARREWDRYEGTAQRDLFRELRRRFLLRHRTPGAWALDVGAGPGRFTDVLAEGGTPAVAFDLSAAMLRGGPTGRPARAVPFHRVRGDAVRPPFPAASFGTVALLGNVVGFAGDEGERVLDAAEDLLAPGGTLIVEIAPGAGERSVYLSRLPAGAVGRLFAAPAAAIEPRIAREGFVPVPERHRSRGFRRWTVARLEERWAPRGLERTEAVAVAPALGAAPDRVDRVRPDPRAWEHLLAVEEALGVRPARWDAAAAVLVAARRLPSDGTIKTHPFPSSGARPDGEEARRARVLPAARGDGRREGRPRHGQGGRAPPA